MTASSHDRVRNITIIAHVDHGKTTLSDSLVSAAGKLNNEKAGKACVLDAGEEAERGITIVSTAITLQYPAMNNLVVNLIDSPGHVEFNSQVTAALRITDGAVVVVDVVEGCCVQTETVLRQALSERLRPVLVLNKADRLFLDLQYKPDQVYDRCQQVVADINRIIDMYADTDTADTHHRMGVSLEDGTACIGSGYFGWVAHIATVPQLYAHAPPPASPATVAKALRPGTNFRTNFTRLVIKPIHHMHALASSSSASAAHDMQKALAKLGLSLPKPAGDYDKPRDALRAAMRRMMPAAAGLLHMIDSSLPSPRTAQSLRMPCLYPPLTAGDEEGDCDNTTAITHSYSDDAVVRKAIETCDADGPVMMFISKTVNIGKVQVGLGRLFSGTLTSGTHVYVTPADSSGPVVKGRISRLVVVDGHSVTTAHSVTAGHVCGVVGLSDQLPKSGTVSSLPSVQPFPAMTFAVSPVVRVAIRCEDSTGTARLSAALHALTQQDPCAQTYVDPETKQHILAGSGELHLEVCTRTVRDMCGGLRLSVSEAIVSLRESVTCHSTESLPGGSLGKSANKHNRFWFTCSPLPNDMVRVLEANESEVSMARRVEALQACGWTKSMQRKVLVCGGPEAGSNLLVDATVGVAYLQDVKDHIVSAFTRMCMQGPLCRERLRGVRIDLVDAKIHAEGAQRRANQIVPACVRAMSAAILRGGPVIQEPIYQVEVQLPSLMVGTVHSVLSRRRGTVELYTDRIGDLCDVQGHLPVMEAKPFTAEIREQTHGKAFPYLRFDHWREMGGDTGAKVVVAARERKQMPPAVPTAESLEDKL